MDHSKRDWKAEAKRWETACNKTQEYLDIADADFWREHSAKEWAESEMAKAAGRCLDLELRLTAILAVCQNVNCWGGSTDCILCKVWRLAQEGQ